MNYRGIFAGLCILICALIFTGFAADDNIIENIATQLAKWSESNPVEKVYLQFDKPYYAAGDDIWFKAYITLGAKHQLSGLSGVLNVELIDDRDSVKQHIKLPLNSGLTWGDFALADTVQEGNYHIRAYTNYMRNAGEDYFFDQHITIVNAASNKVFTKTNYTYTTQNGQQKVSALINYADINGVPYTNKPVKYQVQLNAKNIAKGKGVTDANGDLNISFISTLTTPLHTGTITTGLLLDDKEVITKTIPVKATSADIDVQFFPEGGTFINGINSTVAFKAVSSDGLGVAIKGTIVDDKNNTVTTFSSRHLGMGSFIMKPAAGVQYKARILCADGSQKTVELPKAADKGYFLSIKNDDPDKFHVVITTSRQTLAEDTANAVSLVGQSGGQIFFAAKSKPGATFFTANVPRDHFPSGIVQFTLFSSTGEPINERLIFNQNPDQLKIDINSQSQTYTTRQKVKINLAAQTNDAKPVIGSFSVAVTDESKVPANENSENNILANLLLTSDLRGYIEQPAYYFNHVNDQTRADLDLLMLTQGYHRFEWKKILKNEFPAFTYQPEKTLNISGSITTTGGKPIPHGKVTLLALQKGFFLLDTVTDEQGNFSFKNLEFADSVRFVIQARTDKGRRNVQINLNNVAQQGVVNNKTLPDIKVSVNDDVATYLKSSKSLYSEQLKYGMANHSIVLKEVVIKSTRIVVKHSSNLNGPGNADQVLTGDQIPIGCATVSTCLQGRFLGVIFRGGVPYSTRGGRMTILLDGIKLMDEELDAINMDDIASIEVLRTPIYYSIYGSDAGPGGTILFTSKNGSDDDKRLLHRLVPGILTYTPIGYYKSRMFYSPQYDDPKVNPSVADLRSTIYWNPNIITDKNGKASFEYFNAGGKGTYRVVVEGMDADGNIGRQVYRYKVE